MTVAQRSLAPQPVTTAEPSRFAAYTAGCEPDAVGATDRIFALVQRLLVPELSRMSRRRGRS